MPATGRLRLRWDRISALAVALCGVVAVTVAASAGGRADASVAVRDPASTPAVVSPPADAAPAVAAAAAAAPSAPATPLGTSGTTAQPSTSAAVAPSAGGQGRPGVAAPAAVIAPGCAPPQPAAITTAPGAGRTVALTFDDGPSTWTPQVLDTLRNKAVLATFFVIGRQVGPGADTVRRANDDGHLIGNHTWSHNPPAARPWNAGYLTTEIDRTSDALATTIGGRSCWFRPPDGVMPGVQAVTTSLGLDVVLWSVDSRDWAVQSGTRTVKQSQVDQIVRTATSGIGQPHPVVLLHDGGGFRGATAAALPRIIDAYRAAGYGFITLDGRHAGG